MCEAVSDGEAEAVAIGAGGGKGVKDVGEQLWGDGGAVVGDGEEDVAVVCAGGVDVEVWGGDGLESAGGVGEESEEDLVEGAFVGPDAEVVVGVGDLDGAGGGGELGGELDGRVEDLVEVEGGQREVGGGGQELEILDEGEGAADAVMGLGECIEAVFAEAAAAVVEGVLEVGESVGEGVIEFVGDGGGEGGDGDLALDEGEAGGEVMLGGGGACDGDEACEASVFDDGLEAAFEPDGVSVAVASAQVGELT